MKNIICFVLIIVLAVFTGYNVCRSDNTFRMSELTLANVEALAEGEGGSKQCFWTIDYLICSPYGVGEPCYCG